MPEQLVGTVEELGPGSVRGIGDWAVLNVNGERYAGFITSDVRRDGTPAISRSCAYLSAACMARVRPKTPAK